MERELVEKYINNIERHIEEVIKFFPYLKICYIVPYRDYPLFYLSGILIPKKFIDKYSITYNDLVKSNEPLLRITAVIPFDYQNKGCKVYDSDCVIDWELIPDKHKHCNGSSCFGNELCTHLPDQAGDMSNPILENLKTAYRLFTESQNYIKNGKWNLKEYSHGEEGRREYYETRFSK